MPNLTSVGISSGVPNSGTGTVSTLDNLIGTAGSASAQVQTVQGIASMTALKVDPSAVTSPISAASLPLPSGAATSALQVSQNVVSCTTGITRPANTTAYSTNTYLADSTSAPTAGGYTFTSAGNVSGGAGVITDICVVSSNSPGTTLQGELHIFDSAPTAGNDAAAWALSAADALKRVAVVPFTLSADGANNSTMHAQNLQIGYTCIGTANLRFLVKVKNAYTPASGEVLTFRLKARLGN